MHHIVSIVCIFACAALGEVCINQSLSSYKVHAKCSCLYIYICMSSISCSKGFYFIDYLSNCACLANRKTYSFHQRMFVAVVHSWGTYYLSVYTELDSWYRKAFHTLHVVEAA